MRTHFITPQEQRPSMLHKHRISLIATAQIRTAYTIYIIYTRAYPQSLHHNPQPTQRNDRAKSQTWHTSRSVRIADQRIRLPSHEAQRMLQTIAQALRCITPSEYRLAHPFHRNASPPHENPHTTSNLEVSTQEFRNTGRTSEESTKKRWRNILEPKSSILEPKSSIHKYYTLRQQSPATPGEGSALWLKSPKRPFGNFGSKLQSYASRLKPRFCNPNFSTPKSQTQFRTSQNHRTLSDRSKVRFHASSSGL